MNICLYTLMYSKFMYFKFMYSNINHLKTEIKICVY